MNIPTGAQLVEQCSSSARARKALAWASRPIAEVPPACFHHFGPAVVVISNEGEHVPLPAPWWLSALEDSVVTLTCLAARTQPRLATAFKRYAALHVIALLRNRLRLPVVGPVFLPDGAQIDLVVNFGERTLLLINLFCTLTIADQGKKQLKKLTDALEAAVPGTPLRLDEKAALATNDARLVRVLIPVVPCHSIPPSIPGIAAMSLDDFEWITSRVTKSPDDLFFFCRDLAERPGIGEMLYHETINAYEFWHERGKCFHTAGVEIQSMVIEPHQGNEEWLLMEKLAPFERALLALGLAPTHAWEYIHLNDNGTTVSVGQQEQHVAWEVLITPITAVQTMYKELPSNRIDFSFNLGHGILWKLNQIWKKTDATLRHTLESRPLRVRLEFAGNEGPPVSSPDPEQHEIRLIWRESFVDLCLEQPEQADERLGAIFADALFSGTDRERFQRAWNSIPRALSITEQVTGRSCLELAAPVPIHDGVRAAALRVTARSLAEKGVQPCVYTGSDARDVISGVLYPSFLAQLEERIARFSAQALIQTLAVECERLHAQAQKQEAKHRATNELPQVEYDVVEALKTDFGRARQMRIATALALELALKTEPLGTLEPDRFDILEILSHAAVCGDYADLSEAVHHELSPVEITITDVYEIEVDLKQDHYDFNAFNRQSAQQALAGITREAQEHARMNGERQPLLETFPWLVDINHAVQEAYGFSVETLFSVLLALSEYRVTEEQPVARVPLRVVQDYLVGRLLAAKNDEISAALDVLILDAGRLRQETKAHWEVERRLYRLMTHPIVVLPDSDELVIMPWVIGNTAGVFWRYLADGRLPWPRTQLPEKVNDALKAYRSQRTAALEDDIIATAKKLSLKARKNVKKPKSIGLSRLSGEIDALVLDEQHGVLWVVEAKDLEEAFSAPQIASRTRKFFKNGGHIDKLCKKTEEVRLNPVAVAAALGASRVEQLDVRCLMVTRRPILAAFSHDTRVPFTTIDELESVLAGSP
jgi:hypothetical protein